jgi:hypothetical protein
MYSTRSSVPVPFRPMHHQLTPELQCNTSRHIPGYPTTFTPWADREEIDLLAGIPLVGMHNQFREALVDYARLGRNYRFCGLKHVTALCWR